MRYEDPSRSALALETQAKMNALARHPLFRLGAFLLAFAAGYCCTHLIHLGVRQVLPLVGAAHHHVSPIAHSLQNLN